MLNKIRDHPTHTAPAILLLAQAVAAPFGYKWDFANLGTQLTAEKKSEKNRAFFVIMGLHILTNMVYYRHGK